MNIIRTIAAMQAQARAWQRAGRRLGFVPTMGALHEGHYSLVREARRRADVVVVSIFVNPTQFGPAEDLAQYPRTWDADCAGCERAGADAIFAPDAAEMYPADASTWVVEEQLSAPLCGERRPGHFRGVATVVAKLFLAVLPDVAVFGQKDAQQALVIRRLVRDLNFPLDLVVAPTVREPDGLALSSRNRYLNADERRRAAAIYRGLQQAHDQFARGERDAARLVATVRHEIAAAGGRPDYVELRDAATLAPVATVQGESLLAVAAFFGATRLLDNLSLTPG